MRNSDTRRRFGAKPAEMLAQYWDNREDELLDAVLTAVALVARADGRIDAAERSQLLDFLHRKGILTVFTPAEILETFEHRVRELNEPGGPVEALKHLRRHAEGSLARHHQRSPRGGRRGSSYRFSGTAHSAADLDHAGRAPPKTCCPAQSRGRTS